MSFKLQDAEVIWPPKARDNNEFRLKTEPGQTSMVLFRKSDSRERQATIRTIVLSPVLLEDALMKLCRSQGEKAYFEEGHSSYYQTFQG